MILGKARKNYLLNDVSIKEGLDDLDILVDDVQWEARERSHNFLDY